MQRIVIALPLIFPSLARSGSIPTITSGNRASRKLHQFSGPHENCRFPIALRSGFCIIFPVWRHSNPVWAFGGSSVETHCRTDTAVESQIACARADQRHMPCFVGTARVVRKPQPALHDRVARGVLGDSDRSGLFAIASRPRLGVRSQQISVRLSQAPRVNPSNLSSSERADAVCDWSGRSMFRLHLCELEQ